MKTVRKNGFETNSSSVHSLSISRQDDIVKPYKLHEIFEEFGQPDKLSEEIAVHKGVQWPQEVLDFVRQYVDDYPLFYLGEIQKVLEERFPRVSNASLPTIKGITH